MANNSKEELKAALEGFLSEARQGLEPHPSPDELVAYSAGELPAAEEARVQNHLALCPHCLELLLDFERFSEPGPDSEESIPAGEKAAAWQALQPRLAADVAPLRRSGLRRAFPRLAYALAAGLFAAVVGLSLRVWHLERSMADLSDPQVNAPVVDLLPASPLRGEPGERAVVELPPDSRFFALILNPKGSPDFAGYRAEILDAGGRVVWSEDGLEKNPHGSFTLILSRRFLRPGDYRLRLYGLEGGAGRLLEEFRVRIVL